MKKNLKLSIIIPTRNNEKSLDLLLSLISKQTYKNLEIIVSDGLSQDKTRQIAIKYNARIVDNKKILAEPGVTLGMTHATGDLIMVLAVDNYFYQKDDLFQLVHVFDDESIFAAFPLHESKKNYSLYSKYINTFTDPFNHFVYGYAANGRTFKKIYKTLEHHEIYDIYEFNSSPVRPILAFAQGFTVRNKYSRKEKDFLDDIVPIFEIIEDKKKIAFVHSVKLYHDTTRDTKHFLKKIGWTSANALNKKKYGINHRRNTLSTLHKIKMYIFPIYSLSIIFPILVSMYFAIKDKEYIWLFHPWISLLATYAILKEYGKKMLGFTNTNSRI